MHLHNKTILIMGLGVHGGGLGVARWLLRQGARITVTDMASREALAAPLAQLEASAAELGATVAYTLGEHRAEDVTGHEMLVVNPAVRPDSPWLALARQAGVPIETEMTLFFRACPGPILGVTGTKGKTTTSLLLAAMLREQFPDTVAAGNLRVSALEALERMTPTTPVVLELSSFQLERMGQAGLSPRWSLITNLSADHLNWHGSMAAYANAKAQIFAHQGADGVVVLPLALAALRGTEGAGQEAYANAITAPAWPGGGYPGRLITYDTAGPADARVDAAGALRLGDEALLSVADIRLPGAHNVANVLAAAALARAFGVEPAAIRRAVRGFGGVEHRLELVRELGHVRYVNDTTATNPAAALAALAAIDEPIVLIAGGADKQLEFAELGRAIAARAKALVLLEGSATGRLVAAVGEGLAPLLGTRPDLPVAGPYGDFAEAIRAARGLAGPGDTVLLSPGCASFGMFRNEFHRGEEFRRIVESL